MLYATQASHINGTLNSAHKSTFSILLGNVRGERVCVWWAPPFFSDCVDKISYTAAPYEIEFPGVHYVGQECHAVCVCMCYKLCCLLLHRYSRVSENPNEWQLAVQLVRWHRVKWFDLRPLIVPSKFVQLRHYAQPLSAALPT